MSTSWGVDSAGRRGLSGVRGAPSPSARASVAGAPSSLSVGGHTVSVTSDTGDLGRPGTRGRRRAAAPDWQLLMRLWWRPLRTEGDAVGKRLLRVRAGVVPPTGLAEPRLGVEKELRKRLGVFVGRPQVSAAKRVCAVAHGQQGPSARAGVRLSFPWGRVQGRTCPDSSAAPPCPAAVAAGSTRRRSARGVRPARPGRRCAPRGPRGRRCGHAPRGCTACTPCGAGLVPGTVTGVRPGPREPRGVVPGPGPAGHSARRWVRSGRSRGRPPCPGPRSSCRPSRSAHSCRAPCSA